MLTTNGFALIFRIVDDQEMYEKEKPFTLEDLVAMSSFLNTLVFKLLWNEVVDGKLQVFALSKNLLRLFLVFRWNNAFSL